MMSSLYPPEFARDVVTRLTKIFNDTGNYNIFDEASRKSSE